MLGTWESYSALWLGEMYVDLRQFKTAQKFYLKAMSTFEPDGYLPSWLNFYELCLERAKVLNNEKTVSLGELIKYYDKKKFKIFEGWIARHIAEILINIDGERISAAEEWINKAIESDKRGAIRWYLGRDYALFAELFKRKGDLTNAEKNKNKAINIFRECGAKGWVERYEKELA
jgi:tetratricopeptide (TPR) repeat protein